MTRVTVDDVCRAAKEAIASRGFVTAHEPACGSGSMVIALAEALKHPELKGNIGHPVFQALQNLGPEAKDAVPTIMEELKKADEYFASGLIKLLGHIGPAAKPAEGRLAARP